MSLADKQAEQKQKVLEYYASLPVYKYAAHSAMISEDTLKRWRDDDPNFADQLNQAASAFFNKLGKRMKAEFIAERIDREVWKPPEQEVKMSGIDDVLRGYGLPVGGLDATKEDEKKTD